MTDEPSSGTLRDVGLDILLELNGETFFFDNGYSVKIKASQVEPSENCPHGISYSLTLHEPNNQRVLGYDNAHAPSLDHKTAKKHRHRYQGRKIKKWDHRHNPSPPDIEPYDFQTPGQLLEDFWTDVDHYLG